MGGIKNIDLLNDSVPERKRKLKNRLELSFSDAGFNFKDRFGGIPKSVMKFSKSKELLELVEHDKTQLNDVTNGAKSRGGGYAKNMKLSTYNPDQAYFIIDYYTNIGDKILDPFMSRGTRAVISTLLKREYTGYDICSETVNLNYNLLEKNKIDPTLYHLYTADGIELKHESSDTKYDAIFSCPPYYDKEKYSGLDGDLSYLSIKEFNAKIEKLFKNISQLIKTSSYKERKFYPVIFTVGTLRQASDGLLDMEFEFKQAAYNNGFILFDKLITENVSPGLHFTYRRNYDLNIVTKVHETTLSFIKV